MRRIIKGKLYNTDTAELMGNLANDIAREILMSIDGSEVARALAKAIAYKSCGKDAQARDWARKLIRLLELSEILSNDEEITHNEKNDKRETRS